MDKRTASFYFECAVSRYDRTMSRRNCAAVTSLVVALALASSMRLDAQDDPSIDRLLSKLPPPEKLVKRPVERALDASDPAMRDPLVKSIAGALRG